jgi:rSAM/selenodomain-associated transferase 2
MKISIIVPMLNEAKILPNLLEHLLTFKRQGCEIILVDGGSTDGSLAMAHVIGFNVVHSNSGRAHQMNKGAALAAENLLLFLHADTRLPANAIELIENATLDGQYEWGRFDVVIEGESALLKLVAWMMNWRSALTSIATGDQAIFIRRSTFLRIGGFPEQPLMEDIEFSKRLKRQFKPARVTVPVITSGRRWDERGAWKTIFLMWRLRWNYWRGVPAEKIAAAYR